MNEFVIQAKTGKYHDCVEILENTELKNPEGIIGKSKELIGRSLFNSGELDNILNKHLAASSYYVASLLKNVSLSQSYVSEAFGTSVGHIRKHYKKLIEVNQIGGYKALPIECPNCENGRLQKKSWNSYVNFELPRTIRYENLFCAECGSDPISGKFELNPPS